MSEHPIFCSILNILVTITNTLVTHFVPLADFKVILEKARKQTVHELLRKKPGSLGAKLLTASDIITSVQKKTPGYADALLRKRGNLSENASTNAPSSASTLMG